LRGKPPAAPASASQPCAARVCWVSVCAGSCGTQSYALDARADVGEGLDRFDVLSLQCLPLVFRFNGLRFGIAAFAGDVRHRGMAPGLSAFAQNPEDLFRVEFLRPIGVEAIEQPRPRLVMRLLRAHRLPHHLRLTQRAYTVTQRVVDGFVKECWLFHLSPFLNGYRPVLEVFGRPSMAQ